MLGGFSVAFIGLLIGTASARAVNRSALPRAAGDTVSARAYPIDVLAIDSGGRGDNNWSADPASPAYILRAKAQIITIGVRNPAPQSVYATARFFDGMLVYSTAGLRPGAAYIVRLHFAELVDNARGRRVFNIKINGRRVLTNFDVFATAGGKFRAIVEQFDTIANRTGEIGIALIPVRGNPIINGVEIQRFTSTRVVPIDISRNQISKR